MLTKVISAVCAGIEGKIITVETDVDAGLPSTNIVGLASATVMEARERIKAAITNSGFSFPRGRITINLRPASLRKNSSCLDLAIAVGIMASQMEVNPENAGKFAYIGELSLGGEIVGVDGIMPMVQHLVKKERYIFIPGANCTEANFIASEWIIPVRSLKECAEIINDPESYFSGAYHTNRKPGICYVSDEEENDKAVDFSEIQGQSAAKRAIEISVAGRHGLLMVGSPGCGKTMLARRIPTIMPPMTREEIIQCAIINSVTGKNNRDGFISKKRPFRMPHSSIGKAGLLGGGISPVPGEITFAHNGVLFLDEVCEFDRETIDSLRTPIENRYITHFRRGYSYTFPSNFQLVMAANPCRCGYYGDSERMCKCTQNQLDQYQKKLSGPMIDRIDMRINMERVTSEQIIEKKGYCRSSEEMRNVVEKAISFRLSQGRKYYSGDIPDNLLDTYCHLGVEEEKFMSQAYSSLQLSPRSYNRILKVARTIADMDESNEIMIVHLSEAISYRIPEVFNE